MSSGKMIIVITTINEELDADRLAAGIVNKRLAACVQILPKLRSVYRWEGEIESADEFLLLIKTAADKFGDLEEYIIADHPYEVPEIIGIEAAAVSKPYLDWLTNSVGD